MAGQIGVTGGAHPVGNTHQRRIAPAMLRVAGGTRPDVGSQLVRMMRRPAMAGRAALVGRVRRWPSRGRPGIVADRRERHVAGAAVVLPRGMHCRHRPRGVPTLPRVGRPHAQPSAAGRGGRQHREQQLAAIQPVGSPKIIQRNPRCPLFAGLWRFSGHEPDSTNTSRRKKRELPAAGQGPRTRANGPTASRAARPGAELAE